jgi:hypothetical protein
MNAGVSLPNELFPTSPVGIAPGWVYFFDSSTSKVYAHSTAGSPRNLVSLGGTESLLGIFLSPNPLVQKSRILVSTASPNNLVSWDLDGISNTAAIATGATSPFGFDFSNGAVPDGSQFAIQSANTFGTFMASSTGGVSVDLTNGNTETPDRVIVLQNDLVATHLPGVGFKIRSRFDGTLHTPLPVGNAQTTQLVYSSTGPTNPGGTSVWLTLYKPLNATTGELWGYTADGVISTRYSTDIGNVPRADVFLLPGNRLLWRAQSDGATWLASLDHDALAGGPILPTKVDANAATSLAPAGAGTDPDRIFYVAHRGASVDETLVIDVATLGSAQVLAGSATLREDGRFIPR